MQEDDFTLDTLLAGVPQQHEEVQQTESQACNKENARFAPPVTEADIVEKIHGSIPKTMRKSTSWAVNT